jgi:hypothetical protein
VEESPATSAPVSAVNSQDDEMDADEIVPPSPVSTDKTTAAGSKPALAVRKKKRKLVSKTSVDDKGYMCQY